MCVYIFRTVCLVTYWQYFRILLNFMTLICEHKSIWVNQLHPKSIKYLFHVSMTRLNHLGLFSSYCSSSKECNKNAKREGKKRCRGSLGTGIKPGHNLMKKHGLIHQPTQVTLSSVFILSWPGAILLLQWTVHPWAIYWISPCLQRHVGRGFHLSHLLLCSMYHNLATLVRSCHSHNGLPRDFKFHPYWCFSPLQFHTGISTKLWKMRQYSN